MSTLAIGPGLAGFPAFPELELDSLSEPERQALFVALGFEFTDTSFAFALDSGAFGAPGLFRYEFAFEGDFAAIANSPLSFAELFDPENADDTMISIDASSTVNALTGDLAIALDADPGSAQLVFAQFFGTLLDPRNFTTDILTAFGFDLADFTEIDLSAFANPVILGTPNGATVGPDGTISLPAPAGLPIPLFAPAPVGVISFEDEITELAVASVIGGRGDDVLGAAGTALAVRAGAGDDAVAGSPAADDLAGEAGDDLLVGGGGADVIDGGEGRDVLVGHGTLTGGADADRFVITAAPGTRTDVTDLSGAEGDALDLSDLGIGGIGALLGALSFDGTATTVTAASGQSVVVADAGPGAVLAAALRAAGPGGEGATLGTSGDDLRIAGGRVAGLDGDDRLVGLFGADTLLGLAGDDRLSGGGGDDVLLGGGDDDDLAGGLGADILDGGIGNDTLTGGLGFDVLSGGDGADVFVPTPALLTYDRIADFKIGDDRIDLRPVLGDAEVTAETFAEFVRLEPLGPTELTGFLFVDADGPGDGRAALIAQLDGEPFAIGPEGSAGQLGFDDFIL